MLRVGRTHLTANDSLLRLKLGREQNMMNLWDDNKSENTKGPKLNGFASKLNGSNRDAMEP